MVMSIMLDLALAFPVRGVPGREPAREPAADASDPLRPPPRKDPGVVVPPTLRVLSAGVGTGPSPLTKLALLWAPYGALLPGW